MSKVSLLSLFTTLAISIGASSLHAAAPQLSVSPSSGSGQSQTFTVTAVDSDGAPDIANVSFLINSVFDGESGCWLSWDNEAGAAYFNTDGFNWIYLPSGATLENSRCAVQFLSSSTSGNTVNISFNVAFKAPLSGAQNLWAMAGSNSQKTAPSYQQLGTWTVPAIAPAPDFQVSITPASMTIIPGQPGTYSVAVTSVNGYTGNVQLAAAPQVGLTGLTLSTWGTSGTSIFVPAGGTGVGEIRASASSNAPSGNVTIVATLGDGTIQHTVTATLGIGSLPPTNPPTVSATMSTIIGPLKAFDVAITDRNGYAAVNSVNLLINSTLNGQNACWLNYTPGQNGGGTLSLASDDASTWTSMTLPVAPGQTTMPQNSQCGIGGGAISATGSGNTLTLMIPISLSPALSGPMTMYARAGDADGDSGYQNEGTFTLTGSTGPDFTISDSPGTQTVTMGSPATWQVTITPLGGYTGTPTISVTGLPPDATLNGVPASVAAGKSMTFSVATADDTPAGTYPLTITATDGILNRTASITLIVQNAGIPLLSGVYSPTSANAPVTFHYAASSPVGAAPGSLNVLIANSVDGQHACWFSYNGQLSLASDDASAWLAADSGGNVANSQCSVHLVSTDSQSGELGIWVNITLLGQFTSANKNIYLAAVNQAGTTGYQLMGTWQMQ